MKKLLLSVLTGSIMISGGIFAATPDCAPKENAISYELVLYYFPSCLYCQKVVRYLNKAGIALTMKDTRQNAEHQAELYQLTGDSQVPCLVINGHPMLESNDIIEWLKNNVQSH